MSASIAQRATDAAAVAAQYADAVDREARFPAEAVRALKDAALLGLTIPTVLGGEDASLSDLLDVTSRLAGACSATAMVFAMHHIKLASLVTHGPDHAWHRGFLRRIADQQLLIASSTSEAGVGGDLRNSLCAVEADGDMFRLAKEATVISYGASADAILVTARRQADAPSSDQVLVALTSDQIKLTRTAAWDTLGMRGTCSEGFRLEGRAPVEQILPTPFGEIAARTMLASSHLLWSAVWYGIAAESVVRAQDFVRQEARKKPGVTPLGAMRLTEAVRLLGLMKSSIGTGLERFESAKRSNSGLDSMSFAVDMNNLKLASSTLVGDIVREALLVCGIAGYRNGTPHSLGRLLRDAMSAPLMINNDRIASNTSNLLLVHRMDARLAS